MASRDSSTPSDQLTWRVAPSRSLVLANDQPVILRPLAVDDADRAAEFFRDLTEREAYYFYRLDEERARRLAGEVEQDRAFRLVAIGTRDGQEQILGYSYLAWSDTPVPTFGICIRDGAQSTGLGRILIDHLFTSAVASGVGRVELTVHPDNWRALRLYQRFGFRLVDEFINTHQGVKQYRMECDLQLPRLDIADELTIIPIGGIGVGIAAGQLQQAVEGVMRRRPLILDREYRPANNAIFVVDLGPQRFTPFDPLQPNEDGSREGVGWITSLDDRHLVIGGIGASAVQRAVHHYVNLLGESSAHIAAGVPIGQLRITTS